MNIIDGDKKSKDLVSARAKILYILNDEIINFEDRVLERIARDVPEYDLNEKVLNHIDNSSYSSAYIDNIFQGFFPLRHNY